MEQKYYVYVYCDPTKNNEPFYVGKGCGNRMFKHLWEREETAENLRKHIRIQDIRKAGFEPVVQIIREKLSQNAAYDLESKTIVKYGRQDYDENGILTNICIDNRPPGMIGRQHSTTTKETIRRKRKEWIRENGNPMKGKRHTEECKEKLRASRKLAGSTITESGRLRISKTSSQRNKGMGNPMYGRKRKAMYNPITLECKYVDITDNMSKVNELLALGWKFGLIRKNTVT